MTALPIFIDVNIPMYAAGVEHPYREACRWVLAEIVEGNLLAVIDTEIVQEVLYRYGALGRWQVAVDMATSILDLVPAIYPVMPNDIRRTVQLFSRYAAQGATARDLVHAAVMLNHELTTIISTDAHFDQIEGIQRIHPQVLFERRPQ
jgi:predicted nucleic acid-binding protein